MLVLGRRATVPAALPTALAISPAASVVAPGVSTAPRTLAPTFEIDWSIRRPIAPNVSRGVGSAGALCCGGSGGVTLSGGAGSCALARLAAASSAMIATVRCMAAIMFGSNGDHDALRARRGENEERLEYAVNDQEPADQSGGAERGPYPEPLFDDLPRLR